MSSDPLDSVFSPPLAEKATASVTDSKLTSPDRSGGANLRQSGNRKEKEKEKEDKIRKQQQETNTIDVLKLSDNFHFECKFVN